MESNILDPQMCLSKIKRLVTKTDLVQVCLLKKKKKIETIYLVVKGIPFEKEIYY